ncbi:MAG: hypothetical protein ACTSUC_01700 [Promethearchaeota archaeon]
METLLRDLVEKDIEKILDNKKILNKNFFVLILHFLLENDRINLMKVDELSKELEKDYKEFLDSFEIELLESNGEIIKVLQNAIRKFKERINPVLKKIYRIKDNANS